MKLHDVLAREASAYNVGASALWGMVTLVAPRGYQFGPDTHRIVVTGDPMPNAYRRAIAELRRLGPGIRRCPAGCWCGAGLTTAPIFETLNL